MVGMSFLQIFLLLNAVILGAVLVLAVQFWLAHKKGSKKPIKPSVQNTPVPAAVRERIAKQAESNFQGIVNRSALQLQHDLGTTGTQLNKLLQKFGSDVLDDEMKLFRQNVADIRNATQGALASAQDQITEQQNAILKSLTERQADIAAKMELRERELEEQLEQSFAAEKDATVQRMNENMNDAVLAFLLETLGHEVDLGAQTDYLVSMLETNKAEIIASASGYSRGRGNSK
jgi:hypothetical protein